MSKALYGALVARYPTPTVSHLREGYTGWQMAPQIRTHERTLRHHKAGLWSNHNQNAAQTP